MPECYKFGFYILKIVLSVNVNLDATDKYGRTALHVACERSLTEAASLILTSMDLLNVDKKDNFGWTPLHYCAANDSCDAAKLLLSKGAIVSTPTSDGFTAIQLAAITSSKSTYNQLLNSGADTYEVSPYKKQRSNQLSIIDAMMIQT